MASVSFSVHATPRDGHCQFTAIARALHEIGGYGRVTVRGLRETVARRLETAPDIVVDVFTVENNVKAASKGRRDAVVEGVRGTLWGNEYSLRVIADVYRIGFAVFRSRDDGLELLAVIRDASNRFVLLLLNNEHYENVTLTVTHKDGSTRDVWSVTRNALDALVGITGGGAGHAGRT